MIAQGESNRAQIDRILQSEALRSSDGLRRLLRFLADKSLSGEADQLKEFAIGIDAFGKPPTYDPRHDSTVRIQVGRLRQKLVEYYQSEGKDDPFVVELPKGRFKLNWNPRPERDDSFSPSVLLPDAILNPTAPTRSRALLWTSLALIVVSGFAIYLGLQLQTERQETKVYRAEWSPEVAAIWAPFVASDRPLLLSISAPLFFEIPEIGFVRDATLNRPGDVSKSGMIATIQKALKTPSLKPLYYWTTIGDLNVAFMLGKLLAPRMPHVSIVNGTELSWSQVTENNVVFIGSPKFFNQQLANMPVKPELTLEPRSGVHNYHPKPGEPALFVDAADRVNGLTYALISHMPGPLGRGDIMSIACRSGAGVMGSVRYLTESASARDLVARLRKPSGEIPRYYQTLLKIEFQDGVPVETSYVLHRELRAIDAPK